MRGRVLQMDRVTEAKWWITMLHEQTAGNSDAVKNRLKREKEGKDVN